MNMEWRLIHKSDIFSHFVSLKYLPRWLVLLVDVLMAIISLIATSLILDSFIVGKDRWYIFDNAWLVSSVFFILIQIFYFWLFHTYSGILRYSSFVDSAKLFLAVFSTVVTLLIINWISVWLFQYQIYVYFAILFYGVLSYFFLFIIRLAVKNAFDYIVVNVDKVTPIMIYGTKSAGIAISKMLRVNMPESYKLVGFIDTDKESISKTMLGVKVYELNEKNVQKVISKKARAVIVSPTKMESPTIKKELELFIENGLSILRVPPANIWEGELPSPQQIRSIQIEDLLERPQIKLSTENISQELHDKVILVTGAAGSIGNEIVKQLIPFNPRHIVLLDQAETPIYELILKMETNAKDVNFSACLADVRNEKRMSQIMETYRPNIIFHAAAYKHVPLMEENPSESILTNIKGTKILADLAVKYKVSRFVMISTDKAVNPTNVMGASKRIAEIYVQSLNKKNALTDKEHTKFITTRFGNVLASNGSVIPHFREQIENKMPVTVTHPDIIRYFMTIPEACLLVFEAGTSGNGGEIYVFDMGEPVKILDLAKKMIRLAGFVPNVDIPIVFTGLRPGEKLYEELLNKNEFTKETHHPKIMIAQVREYDYDEVSIKIDELIEYATQGKVFPCVSQMKELIPEYISNNSQFEKLDIEKK